LLPDEDRGVSHIVEHQGAEDSEDALDLGLVDGVDGYVSNGVEVEA
jgi:hypothetical protein